MDVDQLQSSSLTSRGAIARPAFAQSCYCSAQLVVLRAHIPVPGQPVQTRSVESVQTLGTVPTRRPQYGDVTCCSGPRAKEGVLPT